MLVIEQKPRRKAVKLPSLSTKIEATFGMDGTAHLREQGNALFIEMGRRDAFRLFSQGASRDQILAEIDELARSQRLGRDPSPLTERFYQLVRGEKNAAARREEFVAGALLVALALSEKWGVA